jgi:DNA polymerase III sliding clamp (beta) subunit (PCNA family)
MQVLTKMLKVVPKKSKTAILIRLAATVTGMLEVLAVNGKMTLKASLPVSVESTGSICVPPKTLADLVKSIARPGHPIHVDHDEVMRQLTLTSGTINHVLGSSPGDCVEDTLEEEHAVTTIRVPVATLRQALDRLSPVQALDPGSKSITDTCVDLDETGKVSMVTTDTYRLAIVKVPDIQVSGDVKASSWVLRNSDLVLLAGVMKGKDSAKDDVVLSLGTKGWTASWGYYRLTAPFSEKSFPRWRSIVPKAYTNSLQVDGGDLLDRLQMASRLGGKKSARVGFRWNGSSECILAAGNKELGAESTMPLALTWQYREAQPNTELVMDAKLMEPLVQRLAGKVEFAFTASALPAMVKADGDDNIIYLQMPVNL